MKTTATIAWVVHNNSTSMVRLLIAGMRELGRTDIEHISSREDTMLLREPDLSNVKDPDKTGEFPDHHKFVPSLASKDFWKRLRSCDFIVFTINCGANHNAYRAAEIIRRHNLFYKVIYLDEDDRGWMHPDFRDMFLRARLAFVQPRLYQKFGVHSFVVNLGFNGVESRYLKYAKPMEAKKTTVFYRGRLIHRPHRLPFIEALKRRRYPDARIMPELKQNTNLHDLAWQHITGNRHNVSYYEHLADAKIAVTLHGTGAYHGFQFWECAALTAAQVLQSPKPSKWYSGGSYPTELLDYEEYDPRFQCGRHFLTFESPDEMLERIDYLLAHDGIRQEMALACHQLALEHHSSKARAHKFLEYVFREP